MSDAPYTKLTDADLEWIQDWADEWASTDLPEMNETQMARLALSALAEIREHRSACAKLAAQDNASAVAPPAFTGSLAEFVTLVNLSDARQKLVSTFASVRQWMDDEGARGHLVQAGSAPDWHAHAEAKCEWDAALAALDKLLTQGGGK